MVLLYKDLMISPQGTQSVFLSCNCLCTVQHLLDVHWFISPLIYHLNLATLELREITSVTFVPMQFCEILLEFPAAQATLE